MKVFSLTRQMHTQKKNIKGYDYIRTWAILLVIAGHSTALAIGDVRVINPYAGLPGLYMAKVMELIRELIYGFHMPLFVLLSGALFVVSFHKTNLKVWSNKRAKRLLIPYFVVSCLLWEPVRLLVGYYNGISDLLSSFVNDVVLSMDINYLWYVMMLFEVGIIIALIYTYIWPKTVRGHFILCFILWLVSLGQNLMPQLPFQLNRTMNYIFWFYLGMLFETHREELIARIRNIKRLLLLLAIAYIISFAFWYVLQGIIVAGTHGGILLLGIKLVKMCFDYLAAGLGCAFFIILAFSIPKAKHDEPERIGKRSYQIYLYHVPCCILFTWGVQQLVPPSAMTNLIFIVAVIVKFFVGLFGALAIDYLLLWIRKQFIARKAIAG